MDKSLENTDAPKTWQCLKLAYFTKRLKDLNDQRSVVLFSRIGCPYPVGWTVGLKGAESIRVLSDHVF